MKRRDCQPVYVSASRRYTAQAVALIEDGCDPSLLFEGRKQNLKVALRQIRS